MCFSLEWIEHLLILAVVITAIVLILQAIISFVLPKLPGMFAEAVGLITTIIKIVIWAIIIIALIYFAFSMISCLWGMAGGLSLSHR
ncbi:MAG TPA: hypothetical protein VNU19_07410 [Candidatus Acidoferrum sp.]|nr:hypothetical protein [Candidatus Acidoferrum sp.]